MGRINTQELWASYNASPSPSWQPSESWEYTDGKRRITFPVSTQKAIGVGRLFGNLWSAENLDRSVSSAFAETLKFAKETKPAKDAVLPFRMNNGGPLDFIELRIKPLGNSTFEVTE